jgi:hypothetical protein
MRVKRLGREVLVFHPDREVLVFHPDREVLVFHPDQEVLFGLWALWGLLCKNYMMIYQKRN